MPMCSARAGPPDNVNSVGSVMCKFSKLAIAPLLLFTTTEAAGTYACSGSLVASQWLLTAAHCADGLISMSVEFGYDNHTALQTRSAIAAIQHPGWNGTLDRGADIALIKLSPPVTGLNMYSLSTTNDVGKTQLITGYGTSGTGSASTSPSWADGNYGHYGYCVADTTAAAPESLAGRRPGVAQTQKSLVKGLFAGRNQRQAVLGRFVLRLRPRWRA